MWLSLDYPSDMIERLFKWSILTIRLVKCFSLQFSRLHAVNEIETKNPTREQRLQTAFSTLHFKIAFDTKKLEREQ